MNLSGKAVLITGGAEGLGKAYTRSLLREGARVCFVDINEHGGKSTLEELRSDFGENVCFVQADICNKSEFEQAFEKTKQRFGGIDIMINNAGILNEDKWELCLDLNLKALVRGSLLAVEHMRKDKGGKGGLIVNISSSAGFFFYPAIPTYCATKHGVLAFTKSWSQFSQQVKLGVRFVTLHPYGVDTALTHDLYEGQTMDNQVMEEVEWKTTMSVDCVAEAFMRLVKEEDNNGKALIVDSSGSKYHEFS